MKATRKNLAYAGSSVVVGDFWVVPTLDARVLLVHDLLGNPFPTTSQGIAVPAWDAKTFTTLYRCLLHGDENKKE